MPARLEVSPGGVAAASPVVRDSLLGTEVVITASDREPGDTFGHLVAGAGDANGDGFDDLVVAPADEGDGAGAVYVYLGSDSGIDLGSEVRLSGSVPGRFGSSVAGVGDVDGDGFADMAAGAPWWASGTAGAVYLFFGQESGVSASDVSELLSVNGTTHDGFGISVSGAGGVDGDGFADVVVGAVFAGDDGGSSDGGTEDCGASDGGSADGGTGEVDDGKDCATVRASGASWLLALVGLVAVRSRRTAR